jgi:hypothetical protein
MTVYRALERATGSAVDADPAAARRTPAEELDYPLDGPGPHPPRPHLVTATATVHHLDRVIVTGGQRIVRGDTAGALHALAAARGIVASIAGATLTG